LVTFHGLKKTVHFPSMHHSVKGSNRVVGATPGPEAVRAVQKVLLVDGLQHLADGVLDHSVLERRDPYRPHLAIVLRDVDTSDGLMPVLLGL
jgi:hypothetical protein